MGRTLRVERPWPTGPERAERIVRLIALVTFGQFVLNGLDRLFGPGTMAIVWMAAGAIVALGTLRIERYFLRKGRMGP